MIDFQPTDEQQLVIDTVRHFATNEIRPKARECDESKKLPDKVIEQAHELGLVANALPESAGGGGERSAVTGVLVAEELAVGDLAIALAILSPGLTALPIAEFGTDEQKSLLARFSGPRFVPGSLAWVEPRFDFDPFRPHTTARRDGGDYVLDGAKCCVPWIEGTDPVLVVASEAGGECPGIPGAARHGGIQRGARAQHGCPRTADGRAAAFWGTRRCVGETRRRRGRRPAPRAEPGPGRARRDGRGRRPCGLRGGARLRQGAHRFGVPVATKQSIAFKLADMAIEIDAARLLAWEAAWKLDRGEDATREALLAKRQSQRLALDVADGAVQVYGGHGYIRDYLPEIQLRNARGFTSFEALALV